MSRFAICDNCGARDDLCYGKIPILDMGVVLKFRAEGSDEFDAELELCLECRKQLLRAFPKLLEVLKQQNPNVKDKLET